MLVHYKNDKPKRQKFNKYKAYGLRLSYAPDYRHTYSPQCRAEIKRFFRSEWFRALTRLDGEMLITRLENERKGFYG